MPPQKHLAVFPGGLTLHSAYR
jgi:hypothetical protein